MWETAVQQIIKGDVISGLFSVVMAFVISLVNIILYPFGLLIKSVFPDLDQALTALASYFDYAGTYMSWILNSLAIPAVVVTMVATYYLFVFTTTFGAWGVKLVLKWKKALWV